MSALENKTHRLPARDFEKIAILVLGMHRSGTSAVTRVLNLLGVKLSTNLMPPAAENNELGFWESQELMAIHNDILKSADMRWDEIRPFPDNWWQSSAARNSKNTLLKYLSRDFSESNLFVVKDPRICRFAALWIDALQNFNVTPAILIPFRNPLEISASLQARDNMQPAYSHLLWLRHVIEAERSTRSMRRSFIKYEDLLFNWKNIVEKISTDLDISFPVKLESMATEIDRFLNRDMRHHVSDITGLNHSYDLSDLIGKTYRALELFSIKEDINAIEILDGVSENLNALDITRYNKIKKQKYFENNLVKIYQIYFEQSQSGELDPAFIPYDNSNTSRDNEYEIGVFKDNFENKNYLSAEYTGFISWRFSEKINIEGNVFIDFIKNTPGYDVYFVNPFPELVRYRNVWHLGNEHHPEIMQFTQGLLDKLDYNINLDNLINEVDTLSYCNYWVGNKKFWGEYMGFITPLYDYIKHDISPDDFKFLSQSAAKRRDANYFPFIFERMFSTFLLANTANIKYLSYNKYLSDKDSN